MKTKQNKQTEIKKSNQNNNNNKTEYGLPNTILFI